jgi:hypothetical protein
LKPFSQARPLTMEKQIGTEVESSAKEDVQKDDRTEKVPEESEFKLTVRKLEMPVRPRGVLAE